MAAALKEYDAIVVGAGHNGLVTAAYLAAAGLDVAVLERREVVGGACVTEELIPGTRSSSCAFVAAPGLHPRILADLALAEHGLAMYQTPTLSCVMTRNTEPLVIHAAIDRTLRELARRYGRREAQGFLALGSRLRRFARAMKPTLIGPPPPLSALEQRLGGERALLRDFTELSIRELLDRYLEADELRGMIAFLALTGMHGGPSTRGTSYVFAYHAWGEYEGRFGESAFVRGGMGAITNALASKARAHGAQILTNCPVGHIVVRDGAARGVVCADGTELAAKLVVSNADPRRTFLSLIDREQLDPAFIAAVEQLDFRGSLGRVHVAVEGLPQFDRSAGLAGAEYDGWTLLGSTMEALERAAEHQERGELVASELLPLEFVTQSAHDATLATAGRHVIVTGVQQLPSELSSGSWDDAAPELTRRVVDALEFYAPGIRECIIGTHTITPLDLERTYGLTGGNLFHGAMTPEQLFDRRPLPGCRGSETPVAQLLLCGSGTHPGGGVTGIPGLNAASTALAHLGRGNAASRDRNGRRTDSFKATADRLVDREWARRLVVLAARQPRLGAALRRIGQ